MADRYNFSKTADIAPVVPSAPPPPTSEQNLRAARVAEEAGFLNRDPIPRIPEPPREGRQRLKLTKQKTSTDDYVQYSVRSPVGAHERFKRYVLDQRTAKGGHNVSYWEAINILLDEVGYPNEE